MAKIRAIMTRHEEKLFQTIKELGVATPMIYQENWEYLLIAQ